MSLKAVLYAYVIGGFTLVPLLLLAAVSWTIYTSVPVGELDPAKLKRKQLADKSQAEDDSERPAPGKHRKGWLTVRRTFEMKEVDSSYIALMRSFIDSRSKDPKRSRPKDMWYVVLKGCVLYLYEDEAMTECEAAIQVPSHQVVIYPEGLLDGELFTRRNAICLKPLSSRREELPSLSKSMKLDTSDIEGKDSLAENEDEKRDDSALSQEAKRTEKEAREEAFDDSTPWFVFVRSCVEMEDWYLALVHAANYSSSPSALEPVHDVFHPSDMQRLVTTLDDQPDVIPMRWLNALIGRLFFSFYRTETLETYIIGRLMRKLSKVKTPSFLQDIKVTEVSVGNSAPSFSKPMLKELTKDGDAAMEIRMTYKGEVRVTVEAVANISLGQRFKTYTVKLVLAVVLRKLDGNMLVKVKRPPSNRVWYAFTQPPDMVLDVEPVVSERQIKWGMILSTIESRLKEIINESVVMPHMDDIAFFESAKYKHRGGIWADAKRKEHSLQDLLLTPEDQQSSPVPAVPTGTVANGEANLPKSSSADEVTMGAVDSSYSGNEVARTASVPAPIPNGAGSERRKSFDPKARMVEEVNQNDAFQSLDPLQVEGSRGRSATSEPSARRAKSVPAASSPTTETSTTSAETESDAEKASQRSLTNELSLLSIPAPDRGVPVPAGHSRLRSLSTNADIQSSSEASTSTSGISSNDSASSRVSNATSFLANLKSKADKQALSNTAKEAMRKWSANWNGFRREHTGGSAAAEDGVDAGSNSGFSTPTKKTNFADIRAAVANRRERGGSPPSIDETPARSGSAPIDIPRRSTPDEDDSFSLPSRTPRGSDSSPATPPHATKQGPSLLRGDSARAAPSPPKVTTTTDVHTADTLHQPFRAPADAHPPDADADLGSPPVQAVPIKVQPSHGASMTIPGIHASHKGEVMSLGYVPPSPPPPASNDKSRTPTMQSMYRLFKTPSGNSSNSALRRSESPNHNAGDGDDFGPDQAQENTPPGSLSARPKEPAPAGPRPTPPPLPPRTITKAVPVVSSKAQQSSLDRSLTPPSTASDVLRSIVSQDRLKRNTDFVETAEPVSEPTNTKELNLEQPATDTDERDKCLSNDAAGIFDEDALVEGSGDVSCPPEKPRTPKPVPPPLPPRKEQITVT